MNPIPTMIRIGGIDYDVKFQRNLRTSDDVKLDGSIDYRPYEITIDADIGMQGNTVVLWHEILHGIIAQAGWKQPDDEFVEMLAYGITQVLRDNPELCSTS